MISKGISTHTSLAGRDKIRQNAVENQSKFLLTRPSRDVTFHNYRIELVLPYISTHTSLAGRDGTGRDKRFPDFYISTHTSLAGRDMDRAGVLA